jgi:hypothetical protein
MENRREVPRYACELPAHLSLTDGQVVGGLTVTGLGVKGCGTTGTGVPAVRQKGNIVIEWQGWQFQAEAEVVWKKKDILAGFRFTSVDKNNQELLIRICTHHPLQPHGTIPKASEKE